MPRRGLGIRCPISPPCPPARSAASRWPAHRAGLPGRRPLVRLPRPLPDMRGSLAGAALHRARSGTADPVLRCPRCHAHFDVVHAGTCVDDDADSHLEPMPLLIRDGVLSIAMPAEAPGCTMTSPTTCWPHPSPAGPRAGRRAVRDVLRADRRGAPARGEYRRPTTDVRLPRLLSAVHRPCGRLRYRAVPGSVSGLSRISRSAAARGTGCRSRWPGVLLPELRLERTVAFYPGPAGATESELDLDAWHEIRAADPRVDLLADDTEALISGCPSRRPSAPAPNLSGAHRCLLRVRRAGCGMLWRGFDGGQQARRFIDEFFATITGSRARRGA